MRQLRRAGLEVKENSRPARFASKRKAEVQDIGSANHLRARRDVREEASPAQPLALANRQSSEQSSGEGDAQVALLQLAALTVGGPRVQYGEQLVQAAAPPEQPPRHQEQHPPAAAAAAQRQPLCPPPHAAPATRTRSEEAEVGWLAAMQLSPLVDLRSLGPALEAADVAWPSQAGAWSASGWAAERGRRGEAAAAQAIDEPTPAALVRVSVGTPPSQAKGLPHPSALDFGGPQVPPAPPCEDGWVLLPRRAAPQRPATARNSRAAAAAAATTADPPLRPQSTSAVDIPHVVMRLPLHPAARLGPGQGSSGFADTSATLVPVLPQPPVVTRVPPAAVPTAAAFARLSEPARCTAAQHPQPAAAAASSGEAPSAEPAALQAPAVATAAPSELGPPADRPSSSQPSSSSGQSPQPERSRRQRRQVQRSEEFRWSDEEAEAGGPGLDPEEKLDEQQPEEQLASSQQHAVEPASDGDEEVEGKEEEEEEEDLGLLQSDGSADWRTPGDTLPSTGSSDSDATPYTGRSGSSRGGSSSRSSSSRPARKRGGGSATRAGGLQQKVTQAGLARRLQDLMHLAAPQAAASLGCSIASFRALCRSVGIQRWPSRRPASGSSSQG